PWESSRRRPTPRMTYTGERILLSSHREGQVSRFRKWVFLVVPLLAVLFQAYVPTLFPVLSFLEMPLLVVPYFAIMHRSQISGPGGAQCHRGLGTLPRPEKIRGPRLPKRLSPAASCPPDPPMKKPGSPPSTPRLIAASHSSTAAISMAPAETSSSHAGN